MPHKQSREYEAMNYLETFLSAIIGLLAGLLTVLFIGLKLTGYITWSWMWVLSPIWISFLLVLVIVEIAIGFYLVINP